MAAFDKDFDKDLNKILLFTVQQSFGCFGCGKGKCSIEENELKPSPDFPQKTCSKCSVALYCNVDCQRKDWRKHHREECAQYCSNRDTGDFCMIECLRGSLWISDDDFETAMRDRKNAFFQAISNVVGLSLQAAVIPQFGKLRFVIAANFWNPSTESRSHHCKSSRIWDCRWRKWSIGFD